MAMTLVSTTTVGAGGVASVTFSSIPQTGKHLYAVFSVRGEYATTHIPIRLRINGNNGSNYSWSYLTGSDTGFSNFHFAGQTNLQIGYGTSDVATANTFGVVDFTMLNYSKTQTKGMLSNTALTSNGNPGQSFWWVNEISTQGFADTTAVTSLEFYDGYGGDFAQYSTISLYTIS